MAIEAKERMLAGIKINPRELIPEGKGKASEQAAEIMQTNRQYITDAKKLSKDAPDLLGNDRRIF